MNEMQERPGMTVESQDVEIDFGRILASLWHFAWLIVLLAVIGASAMYAYSKWILPPEYQSTASLYIHDKNVTSSTGVGSDSAADGIIDYNTIGGNAATYLKNTYKRTLVSDTTLNIVIKNLSLDCDAKALREMIVAKDTDYPYFDITVTTSEPELSAKIANELASVLYAQVSKIVGGSSLTHVDEAYPPENKSGPDTVMNVLLGFAAGFAIGCAIIVLVELTNNKINNDEYLIHTYGLSVLASITDFDVSGHKNKYYKYSKYKYYTKTEEGGAE